MPSRSVAGPKPVATGVDLLLHHAVRQQRANQTVHGGRRQIDRGRDLAQAHPSTALQHREDAQRPIDRLNHLSTSPPPIGLLCRPKHKRMVQITFDIIE